MNLPFIPPFALLENWLNRCETDRDGKLRPTYDDLLDVLCGLLAVVPVDSDWYQEQYPAVAEMVARNPEETPASHFQKHGYFEGRQPFSPGWRDLQLPVPFAEFKTQFKMTPSRGRLYASIGRDEFLRLVKTILMAVPVDEIWYRTTYPLAEKMISSGTSSSARDHYIEQGYFKNYIPFEIKIDSDWYLSRYSHDRMGIDRGYARSAADHFVRIGYAEGCRPVPRQ